MNQYFVYNENIKSYDLKKVIEYCITIIQKGFRLLKIAFDTDLKENYSMILINCLCIFFKSKEWIDTLKINGTCTAITFSSDSRYLFAFGGWILPILLN
jgi:hypothetical protein